MYLIETKENRRHFARSAKPDETDDALRAKRRLFFLLSYLNTFTSMRLRFIIIYFLLKFSNIYTKCKLLQLQHILAIILHYGWQWSCDSTACSRVLSLLITISSPRLLIPLAALTRRSKTSPSRRWQVSESCDRRAVLSPSSLPSPLSSCLPAGSSLAPLLFPLTSVHKCWRCFH